MVIKLFNQLSRKVKSYMAVQEVTQMTERELIAHINDLGRQLDGQDTSRRTVIGEGGDFIDTNRPMATLGRDPKLIAELTLAKEALRRIRRHDLTDEEKQGILKNQLTFQCQNCQNAFKHAEAVTVNGKKLCKACAREELAK